MNTSQSHHRSYQPQSRSKAALIAIGFIVMSLCPLSAVAGNKVAYEDIHLTQGRVCRDCRWEWASRDQVRLLNRQGHATIVPPNEIIGIDKHPIMRKLLVKSLRGIGLPGPIIVPAAFDDANEFVCKYCDTVIK